MKISEVCRETGFSSSTLRFYEKQGLIRNIKKDKHGLRSYSRDDIRWIKFLASMKNARLSIYEMMRYAELYYNKNESFADRLEVTEQCREKLIKELEQLKEGIEFLDCKIRYYKGNIEMGILYDND